jgi:hypothetical protein
MQVLLIKRIRSIMGQDIVSPGSLVVASYNGLAIIEKLGIQILIYPIIPRKERMSLFVLGEGIWSMAVFPF